MTTSMPAVFFGHGSPMNTLEHNRYTEAWRAFGASIPRPRAVLVVSAHWYVNATAVTAMERPRVIHDFFGFPQALFDFDYPAPGSPELAAQVVDAVKPTWVGLDLDSWGLDHGTWSVLAHVFPAADVPVVQLSVHAAEPAAYHLDVGRRLAPLADDGVLVVASGNVVHNLRRIDWSRPEEGEDWAVRFDDHVRALMTGDPATAAGALDHTDARLAVPTPDHFLPLLYVAGIAAERGRPAEVEIGGYAYGSLSMTSYRVGGEASAAPTSGAPSAAIPADVPPEDTNT